jgi:hypothetical protein
MCVGLFFYSNIEETDKLEKKKYSTNTSVVYGRKLIAMKDTNFACKALLFAGNVGIFSTHDKDQ